MHRFRSTLGKGKCVGQDEKASPPITIWYGKIGLGFLFPVCHVCVCKHVAVLLWLSMKIVAVGCTDTMNTYPCVCNNCLCVMNPCVVRNMDV